MSAALQDPLAVPPGQPAQPQITPEIIQQILGIGEEEARQIFEILPQLCQAAQPQFQQGAEFQNIQQGIADLAEYQTFLNFMNSPMVSDCERKKLEQIDAPTLFEIVKNVNLLVAAGTPTKDALSRIAWSDQAKKNVTTKEIAEWILETLIPRILNPLMEGQEQLAQIVSTMAQQAVIGQPQPGAAGAIPGQGIGMGGQPQLQNQPQAQGQTQGQQYPWRNSQGDQLWYKILQKDSNGKKSFMSDSLEMDVVEDSIKIDENGVMTADAVMTAAMVQTYMRDGEGAESSERSKGTEAGM